MHVDTCNPLSGGETWNVGGSLGGGWGVNTEHGRTVRVVLAYLAYCRPVPPGHGWGFGWIVA
eukprot:627117-Prymnesium_polylepis.2